MHIFIQQEINHIMRGLNKVMLIGNAGKDPEFKTLDDGTPVAKLTLATTESYRTKSGEISTNTQWHTIIVWRGLATFANNFIKKGSLLYVEGKLNNRNYAGEGGQKKYVTEVVADQVILLDKKDKDSGNDSENILNERIPF